MEGRVLRWTWTDSSMPLKRHKEALQMLENRGLQVAEDHLEFSLLSHCNKSTCECDTMPTILALLSPTGHLPLILHRRQFIPYGR